MDPSNLRPINRRVRRLLTKGARVCCCGLINPYPWKVVRCGPECPVTVRFECETTTQCLCMELAQISSKHCRVAHWQPHSCSVPLLQYCIAGSQSKGATELRLFARLLLQSPCLYWRLGGRQRYKRTVLWLREMKALPETWTVPSGDKGFLAFQQCYRLTHTLRS